MSTTIKLNKWDPKNSFPNYSRNKNDDNRPMHIRPGSIKPFSLIIAGNRNTGKTTTFMDIYAKANFSKRFDMICIFSSSLQNGYYSKYIDTKLKFEQYDSDIIDALLEAQKIRKGKTGFFLNILIIFDDIVSNSAFFSEKISYLFCAGRHHAISTAYLCQSPTMVHSLWRQNTTHFICLKSKGKGKQHIIDNFLLDLIDPDKDSNGNRPEVFLNNIMKKIFETQYNAIIVEYDKEGLYLNECMSFYKADPEIIKKIKKKNS